jgi:hypothetical protein
MQTIQELADCFFTKYSEEAIKNNVGALSSTMYHERLCEQVRQIIEFHVTEALKAALDNVQINEYDEHHQHSPNVDKQSILTAYPLENIK